MSRVYLDYNASAPLHPRAKTAMSRWLDLPGNPHSVHATGQRAFAAVEDARDALADALGVRAERIVFTSGATEANALALAAGDGHGWAVSAVEHPSVKAWGRAVIPVDATGVVLDLPPGPHGVAVMLANNETGVIQPIERVIQDARSRGVPVHVDATQGPARMPLPAWLWEADTVSISAHKFGGPQGVGALVVKPGRELPSLLRGGPQERGRRAGTLNVVGIVGMGAAAETFADWAHCGALTAALEAGVSALGGRVVGAGAERLRNTVCVQFDRVDAADLVVALDLQGVEASAGAACASGSTQRSHVLVAMGLEGSATRFSLGWRSTPSDVEAALAALGRILAARYE